MRFQFTPVSILQSIFSFGFPVSWKQREIKGRGREEDNKEGRKRRMGRRGVYKVLTCSIFVRLPGGGVWLGMNVVARVGG